VSYFIISKRFADEMNNNFAQVCSSTAHPIDEAYNNPKYRSRFTTKVLLVKAFQGFIIWGALMGLQCSDKIAKFHTQLIYLAYLAL
jgi:hypothetical protein